MAMTLEQAMRHAAQVVELYDDALSGSDEMATSTDCAEVLNALADYHAHITQPAQAVDMARRFHEAYERLAPSFGYETRHETRVFDPESPNGKLMIAVCAEITAQTVDIGAIREVIESHVEEAKKLRHDPESQDYLHEQADKLTRAIKA